MQIDVDCIAAILIAIEDITDGKRSITYPRGNLVIPGFERNIVEYHAEQCELSGWLLGYKRYVHGGFCVRGLTPQGHEMAAGFRNPTIKAEVKKTVKEKALSFAGKAAETIMTAAIKAVISQASGV